MSCFACASAIYVLSIEWIWILKPSFSHSTSSCSKQRSDALSFMATWPALRLAEVMLRGIVLPVILLASAQDPLLYAVAGYGFGFVAHFDFATPPGFPPAMVSRMESGAPVSAEFICFAYVSKFFEYVVNLAISSKSFTGTNGPPSTPEIAADIDEATPGPKAESTEEESEPRTDAGREEKTSEPSDPSTPAGSPDKTPLSAVPESPEKRVEGRLPKRLEVIPGRTLESCVVVRPARLVSPASPTLLMLLMSEVICAAGTAEKRVEESPESSAGGMPSKAAASAVVGSAVRLVVRVPRFVGSKVLRVLESCAVEKFKKVSGGNALRTLFADESRIRSICDGESSAKFAVVGLKVGLAGSHVAKVAGGSVARKLVKIEVGSAVIVLVRSPASAVDGKSIRKPRMVPAANFFSCACVKYAPPKKIVIYSSIPVILFIL